MSLRFSPPLLLAAFTCLILFGPPAQAEAEYRLQVGQPHAEFVLPRIDNGKPVSLSQFRGKKVVLVAWSPY